MKKIITFYIFCFLFGNGFAQVKNWTWMSGDKYIQSAGHYGVQGIPDTANYPPAVYEPCDWQDQQGNFWVFGGFCSYFNSSMADLWKYNIATNEWTWMQGTPWSYWWNPTYPHHGIFQVPDLMNTPGNRQELAASWTDNNGNLWLFGGASQDSLITTAIYNDMWKYDVSINQWVWMNGPNFPNDTGYYGIKGVASPLNRPPSRMAFAKWKDAVGNFYLFGGLTSGDCGYEGFNDVWKYDIALNNCIWIGGDSTENESGSYAGECVTLNSNIPRNAFENRSTCYDSLGNVFMFGSIGGDCGNYSPNRNELWLYSIINNEWTLLMQDSPVHWGTKGVPSATNAPPKTFGSLGWYRNDEVWIFGGSRDGNSKSYNCLWRYSIDRSCFPTGISENSIDEELVLFPNPFTDKLTITTKSNEQLEVSFYDVTSRKISNQSFKNSTTINTSQLAKGIYIYEVRNKNGVIKKGKVVKD